jgi:hypothetical protein
MSHLTQLAALIVIITYAVVFIAAIQALITTRTLIHIVMVATGVAVMVIGVN